MTKTTICKFCKQPISLEIDDGYAAMGDPYKLIPFAACNHCGECRVERRGLEDRLGRVATLISLLPAGQSKDRERLRFVVIALTKRYARLIAKWNRMEGELWEDSIVEAFMEYPGSWGKTVGRMWRSFQDWKRSKAQTELPAMDV